MGIYMDALPGSNSCTMNIIDNDKNMYKLMTAVAGGFVKENNSKIWLNLTNGLELAPHLIANDIPFDVCRFRSCSFERADWGAAIDSMPDDMLMRLAQGQRQIIIDFGANRPCSRAMRQGIPIAVRMLSNAWGLDMDEHMWMFDRSGMAMQCDDDFARCAMSLNKKQRRRLEYFRKYLNTDSINITLLCSSTVHDGDYNYYVDVAMNNV